MTRFYDRHLRAIGQSLETRRINVFELKSSTGEYVVTGTPEKPTSFVAVIGTGIGRLRQRATNSHLRLAGNRTTRTAWKK